MTETYWLIGVLGIAPAFITLVSCWAMDVGPPGVLLGGPFYVFAIFGLYNLLRRRKYSFLPNEQVVEIDGYDLSNGSYKKVFSYSKISVEVIGRWLMSNQIEKRYFAIFRFPGIQVSFFSSRNKEEVIAAVSRLRAQLNLKNEPNQ